MSPTGVPAQDVIDEIIVEGNSELLVTTANEVGSGLARSERLTTGQIRNFFGAVRQIEAKVRPTDAELSDAVYRQFLMLKPKLAYQAERERQARKGDGVAILEKVLRPAIDAVGRDARRFHNFMDFFEAILAYHKAAGGRD
jgi:CRISPR-associated protein Csm2